MDGVVYKKFGTAKEISDGLFPLFGFACADYLSKYNADKATMDDRYIFGGILESDANVNADFFRFVKLLMKNDKDLVMVIIDIDAISDDSLNEIMEELDGAFGFEELKDVYEDRIVFARKV